MSLLNQFPEIYNFFRQDKIQHDKLNDFILSIKEKYTDKSILNAALTYIELELLKFTLQQENTESEILSKPNIKPEARVPVTNFRSNNLNSNKKIRNIQKENGQDPNQIKYENSKKEYFYVPLSIQLLSKNLNWPIEKLLVILNKNNIYLSKNDTLTKREYKIIEPDIKSRVISCNKFKKHNSTKINSKNQKSNHNKNDRLKNENVYDQIGRYGLGKLIYIRSK